MAALSRRTVILIPGFAALSGLAACTTFSDLAPSLEGAEDQTAAALPLVNQLRSQHGLAALGYDKTAASAALDQAARMARYGQMEHNLGFGADFKKRMKGMHVPLPAAENIAMGQDSTERAVTAWINSPKHLVNMLGDYRGLGVASAQNAASANKPFWAMVLSS